MKTKMIRVAVVGTPGTGKSHFARRLATASPSAAIIEVNEIARARRLFTGTDRYGTKTVDMKRLGAAVRAELRKKRALGAGTVLVVGHLVPYSGLRFDLAVVTRCRLGVLLRRLKSRGYPKGKISDNMLCEAMDCVGSDMVGKAAEIYEIATDKDSRVLARYVQSLASNRRHKRPRLKEINLMGEMYSMISKGEFGFGAKS